MGKGPGTGGRSAVGTSSSASATSTGQNANTHQSLSQEFGYVDIDLTPDYLKVLGKTDLAQMTRDMRAELPAGFKVEGESVQTKQRDMDHNPDVVQAAWYIYDPDGNYVGRCVRSYAMVDGKRICNHELFKIERKYENKGLGKHMLRGQLKELKKGGFDEIRVHANIDVGSYAWSRYGFDMATSRVSEFKSWIRQAERNARDDGHEALADRFKEMRAKVAAREHKAINSGAEYVKIRDLVKEYKDEGTKYLNKAMKHRWWEGRIELRNKEQATWYASYCGSREAASNQVF